MTNKNFELLQSVRDALDEIPVRTYNEVSVKLGVFQAIDQILREEGENLAIPIAGK